MLTAGARADTVSVPDSAAIRCVNDESCRGSFGAIGASCSIDLQDGTRCRCTASVNAAIPEGDVVFIVEAIAVLRLVS